MRVSKQNVPELIGLVSDDRPWSLLRLRLGDTLDTRDAERLREGVVGVVVLDAEGAVVGSVSVQCGIHAVIVRDSQIWTWHGD